MTPMQRQPDRARQARVVADAQREQAARKAGYRDQALAIFPHVCARCGRSFAGKTLRELTVHHKDHDHMNNPPDGSNWELLCLYCHDDEHQKSAHSGYHDASTRDVHDGGSLAYNPFAGLADRLEPKTPESESK